MKTASKYFQSKVVATNTILSLMVEKENKDKFISRAGKEEYEYLISSLLKQADNLRDRVGR